MTMPCQKCEKDFAGDEYTFFCVPCTNERMKIAREVDAKHRSVAHKGNFQLFEESAQKVELVTPYGKVNVLVQRYNP